MIAKLKSPHRSRSILRFIVLSPRAFYPSGTGVKTWINATTSMLETIPEKNTELP